MMETPKQEWERIFGEQAIEVLENENSDLSFALAEAMEWLGIEHGRVGDYEVYLCDNGSAAAIRVDDNGNRLPSRIAEIRAKGV